MIIETIKLSVNNWFWRVTSQGHHVASSRFYSSKANADRAARKFFNNAYKLRLVVK